MLWHCTACTTAYSVDAPACPHCGCTEYKEGDDMAKITVYGGASNEYDPPAEPEPAPPVEGGQPDEEVVDFDDEELVVVQVADLAAVDLHDDEVVEEPAEEEPAPPRKRTK